MFFSVFRNNRLYSTDALLVGSKRPQIDLVSCRDRCWNPIEDRGEVIDFHISICFYALSSSISLVFEINFRYNSVIENFNIPSGTIFIIYDSYIIQILWCQTDFLQDLLEKHEKIHRKKGSFHLNNWPVLFLTIDFVYHCCWTVFQRKFCKKGLTLKLFGRSLTILVAC